MPTTMACGSFTPLPIPITQSSRKSTKPLWTSWTAWTSACIMEWSGRCSSCAVCFMQSTRRRIEIRRFDLRLICTRRNWWTRSSSLQIRLTERPRSATITTRRKSTHGTSAISWLIRCRSTRWARMPRKISRWRKSSKPSATQPSARPASKVQACCWMLFVFSLFLLCLQLMCAHQ